MSKVISRFHQLRPVKRSRITPAFFQYTAEEPVFAIRARWACLPRVLIAARHRLHARNRTRTFASGEEMHVCLPRMFAFRGVRFGGGKVTVGRSLGSERFLSRNVAQAGTQARGVASGEVV